MERAASASVDQAMSLNYRQLSVQRRTKRLMTQARHINWPTWKTDSPMIQLMFNIREGYIPLFVVENLLLVGTEICRVSLFKTILWLRSTTCNIEARKMFKKREQFNLLKASEANPQETEMEPLRRLPMYAIVVLLPQWCGVSKIFVG